MTPFLEKALAVFESGKLLDVEYRIQNLKALYAWIQEQESEIEKALFADLAKSNHEAFMTEIGIALSEISYVKKHLKKWVRQQPVKTPLSLFPAKSYKLYRPYGPVLILSPWNYPFLLAVEPLISAISAGNSAVVKPSLKTPHVSNLLLKLAEEVFPNGDVQVALGNHALADTLLSEPFRLIFFTGSPNVGRHVMELASRNLTPVVLELGGKSPCVVDESANLELAAQRITFGKLTNAGQTCIAPDFLYVQKSVKQKLEALLVKAFKAFAPQGANTETLANIIDFPHLQRLQNLVQNEKVLLGGKASGKKFAPTLLSDVAWDSPVMQQEIFGPILPILSFESEAEMLAKLQTLPHPLAFYVFTSNKKRVQNIQRELHFGGMCVNDTLMQIGSPELPFGGVGNSGMGRYHGEAGFKTFSHEESVLERGTWLDLDFRYPPFTDAKKKLVHFFLK
ncbi:MULTISPECIES: aldehyde dehydrogenase family protein [Hallerella]|uniref:aldehyde dehydrogenase family protein n=1 Tax=Hallerella TaxID=2815788 RepID=UPI00258919B7|nr:MULTISPECIES: aldehyde dehydrogenase family protein [Hallerella]MCI6872547.1 aldehyde dehydrogenase family protein [Hallerella sp.]MDY5028231.1 aldehyde dehydrogenase family protein [Hallerella succinigenes]